MTDDPRTSARGEKEPLGDRCGAPLPGVAAVERIIAHNFGEAVAIDDLVHALTGELLRLVDSGVSIAELGAPEEVAGVMIRAIH